jgi:hypothetical protein
MPGRSPPARCSTRDLKHSEWIRPNSIRKRPRPTPWPSC